jgi:hypothetical protein
MKLINVGSWSFLTGSDIADVVMTCSRELWAARRVEIATIPFLDDEGRIEETQFLIGWANPLSTVSVRYKGPELSDDAAVADLRRKLVAAGPSNVAAISYSDTEYPGTGFFDFDEL